ncbi:dsDNA-binding PDCD5 [Fusarium tjaetaba]|uniref:DsDNA-binding PDCD5 n=1 Tax=Fusarium tjaetaba TaxID=1567544 RepID=A0A8H5RM96_9HYPO|nr:dsDNA-binding PDCD5 [Fusarium tjaetaba]KAF5635684.1 dsDNA-binding PDCD5 [Fusarium tjaetaba]
MKTRATTQIARKSTRWLRSSPSFGYTRPFASAVPPTEQRKPEAVPPELSSAPSRPWKSSSTQAGSIKPTSTSPSSQFYVPSVVIPAEAAKSGPVHKIHILGEDVRSRFIAHALCSVYDSVETVPLREMPKSRYRNIEKVQPERTRKNAYVEKNAAISENDAAPQSDRSHIDELIVTGRGYEAVKAIASVKDRIDDKTSICLLNDGMGVLEQVREQLFNGTQPEPNFYLGHMSHALAFNRNRDSVKQLRSGRTVFTKADPVLNVEKELYIPAEQQPSMMRSLRKAKELNTTFSTFEHWLRFKLPSVMFTAAVEPVCVLLDLPYQGLLENRNAQRLMDQLLGELALVTENMPEVQDSPDLLKFLRGEGLKRFCYRRITGKSKAPSDLLTRINKGRQTDINYQNGYFLKRARTLGIDTPRNQLMVQMIKARRIEEVKRLQSFIPVQEASPDIFRQKFQQRIL